MQPLRALLVLAVIVVSWITPLTAQLEQEIARDQLLCAPAPPQVVALAKELTLARRANDVARIQEIEAVLFRSMPTLPAGVPAVAQVAPDDDGVVDYSPTWGNDVKIYTGDLYSYGKRQICLDADTLGSIYLALNARYQDTASIIRVYKSTNGGLAWSQVTNMLVPGQAIQAFDMCITDTTGGKFIIGVAMVAKSDKSTNGGGTLFWVSTLSDGTHFRYSVIGSASSTIGFRNPSICTDGSYYSFAYFFVAAEFIHPSTDVSRGLWITRSVDWGKTWAVPDTALRGNTEGTPVIAVNWGTAPDSLCIAFTRFASPSREIRVASGGKTLNSGWTITYPTSAKDEFDPSLAIDPVRKNGIITYTRATGAPTYNDAMYLRSTDLFKTFTRDSIATTAAFEEYTSVSFAPWSTGYYFRAAYRSSAGTGTIFYKGSYNKITGIFTDAAQTVNQYQPSTMVMPVVGYDRDIGGTYYRGNVAYVGYGPKDVYFDAVDLTLDAPDQSDLPTAYALEQNYPNPFNPATTIRFMLPHAGPVDLEVFNTLGQRIATLANGVREAGTYTVRFDAATIPSGVYFYRLTGDGFTAVKKCILLR
jgi:hypothetical protein